jgi:hypothetical protein
MQMKEAAMKQTYKHTQFGGWTLLLLLLLGVLIAPIAISLWAEGWIVVTLVMTAGLLLIVVLFYALTVEISAGVLSFWFGIGVIRKSYQLEEIDTIMEVKSPWYYGWGVKSIPGGWLYAIWPGTQLEIVLKSGKMFRLGSDQPQDLKQAIEEATGNVP